MTRECYRWLENLRQSIALVSGAPERRVHVGDRESDIYELYCTAQDLGTSFLVRVQTNRLAERPTDAAPHDPAHRVFAQPAAAPWAGGHRITVDQDETTWLQVTFAAINRLPPVGKQKRYSPQVLTYIHALEEDPPAGRESIDWKLVTNLPVEDLSVAVEKLGWYALRWKAEVFHKVMKFGCRAEEARLETAERLAKFLALIAVVSWRIFFVTMSARQARRRARQRSHLRRDHCARPDRRVPNATAPPTAHARRLPCCKSPCLAAISPANMIRLR